MASLIQKNSGQKEDDDEDLEALRLAALMTLRKKQLPSSNPPLSNVVFQPHMGNPNLIAIIPEGAPPPSPHKQPMRHKFYRHGTRQQSFRQTKNLATVGATLKVLPQVKLEEEATPTLPVKEGDTDNTEEVSTKFSRFEDTESESEDESDHEKKGSDSSEEEHDDVLALEDDDDSLEALMAQMEHEIGIDPDPNKREKKKHKGSKCKDKETKSKEIDKVKCETKTAVVEPTVKGSVDVRIVKIEESKPIKTISPSPEPSPERPKCPVQNQPLQANHGVEHNIKVSLPKSKSPVRRSKSPIRQKSPSPPNHRFSPPNSPKSRTPILRIVKRSISPVKKRFVSPRRSPIRSKSPVIRSLTPVRRNSPRRSPIRKSPDRYYNKSPSPYYRSRDRDYGPRNRSWSPKRRSLTPKKNQRDPSPKYYCKLSFSPRSPVYRTSALSRSPSPSYRSRSPLRRRSLSPRNRKNIKPSYSQHFPPYWSPPKRRSPSASPKRRSPSIPPKRRSPSIPAKRRSPSIPAKRMSPPSLPKRRSPSIPPKRRSPSIPSKRRSPSIPPKRRSPSLSPKRTKSPLRKNDYSPRRRQLSPRRELSYRRNSPSPKRKPSPQYRTYSPPLSPCHKPRSLSPRRNSPKRTPPVTTMLENRSKTNQGTQRRTRSSSLSLSPSPPRLGKESTRRYKSPLIHCKESADNSNNQTSRSRRDYSSDGGKDSKRKHKTKAERDREGKKVDNRWKEKVDKETRKEKETNKTEKHRREEPKAAPNIVVSENPVFEARRKKFESTSVIEPAIKKIRLAAKKSNQVEDKVVEKKKVFETVEDKKIEESNDHLEDDKSVNDEIDEIDNFLNEDVLDLSAAFWSSDDDLLPKVSNKKIKVTKKAKHSAKKPSVKEQVLLKEEVETKKKVAAVSPTPVVKRTAVSKIRAAIPPQQSIEPETKEDRKERDEGDLRAELSRRREERLTKAGSLHEKLPARLLQSAFESALGKKKSKKDVKIQKNSKETKKSKASTPPPAPKERTDGRRVRVLKRPAAVRMQSAHINVTFPKDDGSSDSESSYSSSSSDERYIAPTSAKRRLPVYMRLGTTQNKRSGSRKVKMRSRRSQV